jgi:hypothetical protein
MTLLGQFGDFCWGEDRVVSRVEHPHWKPSKFAQEHVERYRQTCQLNLQSENTRGPETQHS